MLASLTQSAPHQHSARTASCAHARDQVFTYARPSPLPAPKQPVIFASVKSARRNGDGSRHADGRRAAGGARGPAVSRRPTRTERHHMDQALRRRTPLPHDGQEPPGTLRRVRRYRGGRRHHGQADQQKQRIWICEYILLLA